MDCSPPGSSVHGDSPGKNTGVGCRALRPGDLPNPGIKLKSSTWQMDSLPSEPPGKPMNTGVDSLSHFEGNLSHPGIESPALQGDSLPAELPLPFMNFLKINEYWYVPDGPVVKNLLSNAGMRVQSLVKELRFHMLWGN